jgi:hypothetical protein
MDAIISDSRVTVWHIAVYVALLHVWLENSSNESFKISRREVMKHAHIGSIVPYHKCIKELQQYKFIDYRPSYHPREASRISILS